MFYVIQENLFKEHHFHTLLEYLRRYNLEYELVRYTPFVHEVEVKTDRKDVWFFGSVNAGMILGNRDWYPGILYGSSFDYEVQKANYGEYMLNSDGEVQEIGPLDLWMYYQQFIRPTRDTKIFESKVYGVDEWNLYANSIDEQSLIDMRKETKMMYCWPKEGIQQEIRCWIVDDEPVTMSQYKIGKRVNMLNMDNNEEARIFARDMCKIFRPARAFVMDICLYQDDYKIVEINCINMSGFYDADMSKLIQSLEKSFGNDGRTKTESSGGRTILPAGATG